MEATERFTALVRGEAADLLLDEAALLIAAHDHPLDVDAWLVRLDDLAAGVAPVGHAGELADRLFRDLGFAGNRDRYDDPRNSYLDLVVERRLGIPITLSILMMEVGRRVGIGLHGVGLPGHFLVGVDAEPGWFVDAFHGGLRLDSAGAEALFTSLHAGVPFDSTMLAATPPRAIVRRVLENLLAAFTRAQDARAVWATRLVLVLPEAGPAEWVRAARTLAGFGRIDEAVGVLEAGAERIADPEVATALRTQARALAARLN